MAGGGLLPPVAEAGAGEVRLAVLEFRNTSGDKTLDALGKGLQSMVTTDLAGVSGIGLVERARLSEVIDEIDLGKSGKVDPKTAARLGKLSGASHLLAGTFTVVGATMRLDARMITTSKGRVLLAEEMTGEKEAFFELEKALVKKLIAALGVKPKPKERARLARIHTADFDAFRRFSQAVDHFDHERYAKATEALRAAMAIDEEFELARTTLAHYEELVAKIRARAARLETTKKAAAAAEMDEIYAAELRLEKRLYEIADEKDLGRRFAALAYLIGYHDVGGRNHGRVSRFQNRGDRFASRRTASLLARQWMAESFRIWPKVPLLPLSRHPPDTMELVDKRVDGLASMITGRGLSERARPRRERLMRDNLRYVERAVKLLPADPVLHAELARTCMERLEEAGAELSTLDDHYSDLAELRVRLGDLDGATAILARWSARETDPRDLERIAKKIEGLADIGRRIHALPVPELARELLLYGGGRPSRRQWQALAVKPPGRDVLRRLRSARRLKHWQQYHENAFHLGRKPAFLIEGEDRVVTGARKDPVRTGSLRYHYEAPADARRRRHDDLLVIIGELALETFDLEMTPLHRLPADWWPHSAPREVERVADLPRSESRPEIGVAFGITDIDRECSRNSEIRKRVCPHPTRGWLVTVAKGEVRLQRLGPDGPAEKQRETPLTTHVVQRKRLRVRGGKTVRVRVRRSHVEVRTAGSHVRFALPEPARGYAGLFARGDGFVELSDIKLEPTRRGR